MENKNVTKETREDKNIIENWEKNKDKYEKNPDPLLIKGLDFSQRILKNINASE